MSAPANVKSIFGQALERPAADRAAFLDEACGGRVALVIGVGDNESFAWFIAKAQQAAGATTVLSWTKSNK